MSHLTSFSSVRLYVQPKYAAYYYEMKVKLSLVLIINSGDGANPEDLGEID
jgi:hypothetical protein